MNERSLKMGWRFVPGAILVLAAGTLAWLQVVRGRQFERELQRLRPEAAESEQLARWIQAQDRRELTVDTNELQRLRDQKLELLRLRGEIGELRRIGLLSRPDLERQIAEARQRAAEAHGEAGLMEAKARAEGLSKETHQSLAGFLLMVQEAALRNGGVVPGSWDEARGCLSRPWRPRPDFPEDRAERVRNALLRLFDSSLEANIKPAAFELLETRERYESRASRPGRAALVLRERTPRVRPEGGWTRAYAFLDGGIEEAISPDGDFGPWERAAAVPGSAGGAVEP